MAERPSPAERKLEEREIQQLRAPFTVEAIKFKLQTGGGTAQQPTKALMVPYIDARLVIERLNHVVGYDWSAEYTPVDGALECALTVRGTTRRDVGLAEGRAAGGRKAWYSDALKRAAVHFGIGVSVYALPKMRLDPADLFYGRDGKCAGLKRSGEQKLTQGYSSWLAGPGKKAFGDPIDHGDAPESIGDHEVTEYIEPSTGEVVDQPTGTTVPKPAAPLAEDGLPASPGPRMLTPKPAHEQQAANATGNPGGPPKASMEPNPDSAAADEQRQEASADAPMLVDTETKTLTTEPGPATIPLEDALAASLAQAQEKAAAKAELSPSEMAAQAMCGPEGWMPRGQSQAAKDEREMIASALAFVAGTDRAGLPKSWPAIAVMAYGHFGEQIQQRDEFMAALTLAVQTRKAELEGAS
jgi:hypothetical protein